MDFKRVVCAFAMGIFMLGSSGLRAEDGRNGSGAGEFITDAAKKEEALEKRYTWWHTGKPSTVIQTATIVVETVAVGAPLHMMLGKSVGDGAVMQGSLLLVIACRYALRRLGRL